jgi:putative membrane protein
MEVRFVRATGRFELRAEDRVPLACLFIYVVTLILSGLWPASRGVWALENAISLVLVPALIFTYRHFRFSDRAYLQGLCFLLLHTVGSRYTYPLVPLGEWARDALDLTRNHYDRLVHFAFGALVFLPLRELLFRRERPQRLVTELFYAFAIVAMLGVGYEFIEWWSALVVDPTGGNAFLGMQGDSWDAQKDMLANCIGGLIAALIDWSEEHRLRRPRHRWSGGGLAARTR